MIETAQVICGLSKSLCRYKETWWWNEEVAEAVRGKRKSTEIGKNITQQRCRRSTRRVDKMQRELFPQQRKRNRRNVQMI